MEHLFDILRESHKESEAVPAVLGRSHSATTIIDSSSDLFQSWLSALKSHKTPLVVAGVCALCTGIVVYMYRKMEGAVKSAEADVLALKQENSQLRNKLKLLLSEIKDLRTKNERVGHEKHDLEQRLRIFETRMIETLEAVTKQRHDAQVELMKEIYRDQIRCLSSELDKMQERLSEMRDALDCSVCYAEQANCLLIPCGHSLCASCYRQIEAQWQKSANRYNEQDNTILGPPCPFCRHEVRDVMAKYNS